MPTDRVTRPHWSLPLVLTGVGAVSGAISAGVVAFMGFLTVGAPESGSALLAMVAPGLVFGLMIGYTIGNRHYAGAGFNLGFAVASTVAWLLAMSLGFALSAAEGLGSSSYRIRIAINFERFWHVGAICGLLGSGIVTAYAIKYFPYPPSRLGAASMVFTGAALGLVLFPLVYGIPFFGWAILLVGWQCGYAASLGFALRLRTVPGSSSPPLAVPPPPP